MAEEGLKPFLRFDLDSADAWQQPLANVRFLTRDTWSLTPIDPQKCEQYGISPDAMPSTEGLDTLNISGSADFSEDQFRQLAQELRAYAGDRPIWVVDCRLESHGLINGISVSWYGDHNWANKGLSLEEAEADEASRFAGLPGSTVTVYIAEDNIPANPQQITVERTMTERELVESEGFHYLRLAANDHGWPEEEAVDSFLAFVEELEQTVGLDNVWLHFHCHAGKSRTAIFMAIYDMIRNPSVSFDDIMLRHAMTGSSYLPYVKQDEMKEAYVLRAQRILQIYDYLHSDAYREKQRTWSAWVAAQSGEKRIFVAETTDIHGYIMDVSSGNEESFQYRLARIAQMVNGLKVSRYGDQMSGLSYTYSATGDADTPREKREYTILSITLEDGTEVDVHDTQTLYRVCTSNFNATVPGSVFEGKTPVVPEADALTDNEAYIRLLREEYAANDGYISVDTRPRGTKVGAE